MEKEIRNILFKELRLIGDGQGKPKIAGYAAVFNQLSDDLGGFREQIMPGAFARSLVELDVRSVWNHNTDLPLGRLKNGTLSLREDETGLYFEVEPPETSWGKDAVESVRRGDVDQMSFGFYTRADEWGGSIQEPVRTLLDVDLLEVSPVTFPAYPQTSAQVRSKLESFIRGDGQEPGTPTQPPPFSTENRGGEGNEGLEAQKQVQRRHTSRKRRIEIKKMSVGGIK